MDTPIAHRTILVQATPGRSSASFAADMLASLYDAKVKEVLHREFNDIPLEVLHELVRQHLPEYAV